MVDAAAMAKGLGETGHIALYGIYFDTDKAVVKPESRPTLEQIAKLLASQPQLNVYIVGHTDSQGAGLQSRSVAAARRGRCRGTGEEFPDRAPRLKTAGVGLLAPVGSNAIRGRPRAEPAGWNWWRRSAGGAIGRLNKNLENNPMQR